MIADQLGHSCVSMTQDVYLVRRAGNAGNVAALEASNPDRTDDGGWRAFVTRFVTVGLLIFVFQPAMRLGLGVLWAPWDSNPQPAD